jgi:hypothetical protein
MLLIDEDPRSEENYSDVFNDDNDIANGYDRNSMMGMLYCIAKALGETNPSFVPILVYLDRICINHENFVISEKNIRRLCVVAICVSNKMFDDFYIANCCYAELLGISKEHLNYLERVFVKLLQYDLNVTSEEYKAYCSHMRDFIMDTFCKQNQTEQKMQMQPQEQMQQAQPQVQPQDQMQQDQMCN